VPHIISAEHHIAAALDYWRRTAGLLEEDPCALWEDVQAVQTLARSLPTLRN
jgi:hypothetical protein